MDTSSGGIAEKWNHYYWESVKHAHKLKILKYPLLCLLTLLFGIAFAVQFCVNGIILLCHKIRSAFSHRKLLKFSPHGKAEEHSEYSEQADPAEKQVFARRFRYVSVLAAVLLLAVAGIFFLQKNSLSTVCIPRNSSSENGTAASETKKSSSQNTSSVPAKLRLEISKPTLGADGNYQFSVTVKADETGKSSSGKLELPDANNSSFQLSGLKPGTNTITVSGKSLGDLLPTSTPKSVIIVDTTSYVMAPNDVYGIRAQLIGQSKDALTAHSSDKQIAGVIKYSSTYYQVVAHKEGSCEIIFEANGMRASTKITVQADTQAHGNAGRVLAAR
jgi:hypothetical protein